ncbi:potassium channel family protein [Natronorubrum daqingense]|uniref:Potassium transporter Trk n=1 Tax=Natronorubrum daqingense TaxID=588898 RepID=A0A1N7DR39_9EURY|nr:TrkA family potassium uptake protein [Natronorubrum daqingense]APX96120.1 potassium transporter Trk [Natronorubrum daqingense]SIR78259.1 trk system potassium uptake protein TrkA [Natronorubrum daqingense]
MYIVIIGAGSIGSNLIDLAVRDGNDVVVVERDETRANDVASRYDCLVLNADATNHATLRDADIERADAVISTTNVDAVNIMVMLLAQEHDVPNLVSVVHDTENLPVFEKIGVTLIENPQRLIADYLYHSVRYPGVSDFIDLDDETELVELTVTPDAPMDGHLLETANEDGTLPAGCLVVALKRDGEIRAPRGDTTIRARDDVTVFTDDATLADAVGAFTGDRQ